MRETWVPSLGWEDSQEEGMATHPTILARRIPMDSPWGCIESDTTERFNTAHKAFKGAYVLYFQTMNFDINSSGDLPGEPDGMRQKESVPFQDFQIWETCT